MFSVLFQIQGGLHCNPKQCFHAWSRKIPCFVKKRLACMFPCNICKKLKQSRLGSPPIWKMVINGGEDYLSGVGNPQISRSKQLTQVHYFFVETVSKSKKTNVHTRYHSLICFSNFTMVLPPHNFVQIFTQLTRCGPWQGLRLHFLIFLKHLDVISVYVRHRITKKQGMIHTVWWI